MPKKPAPKNVLPAELGTVRKQLDRPEKAADLTVAQVTELKERKRLVEQYEKEASDLVKVVQLLRSEYQKIAIQLIKDHNLNEGDDHNLDTENGVIWRTATYVPVTPESLDEAPVAEEAEEAVAATNGKE